MGLSHYGIARYIYEGDAAAAADHAGRGQQMLQRVLARLANDGVEVGGMQARVDDRTYIDVRVLGAHNIVRIVSGYGQTRRLERVATQGVPDFTSGVIVDGGRITQDPATRTPVLASYYPTPNAARLHGLVKNARLKSARLAVQPHDNLREHDDDGTGFFDKSQYTTLKPTLYSGTMQKVVQALMAFGRPRSRSIYDRAVRELVDTPTFIRRRTDAARPSRYEREVAGQGRQIRYDYKFQRSHGIHRAADDRLWLIEISVTRGIVAMPLPINEITQSRQFRAFLQAVPIRDDKAPARELRDDDGLTLFDALGGFPTGETFPERRADLDAMIRAGTAIELAAPGDLETFYGYFAFASMLGWAFSDSGKEAANTAWRYGDDGFQEAIHYQVNMAIGAIQAVEPAPGAAALKRAVAGAANLSAVREREIARKIDRADERTLARLTLEASVNPSRAARDIDAMTLAPIAPASANVAEAGRGKLYNPGKKPRYQLKFHHYELGVLVSHDWTPTRAATGRTPPACDTPVHVFFAGEQLKYVKYFRDGNNSSGETQSDFEPCLYVGHWTRTARSGTRSVGRAFYSNDVDARRELTASATVTKLESKDLGYSSVQFGDHIDDIRKSDLFRTKRFVQRRETTSISGETIYTAVVVPAGDRTSYYLAAMEYSDSRRHSISHNYTYLTDPHTAEGWRCIISTAGFAYIPDDMTECNMFCPPSVNYAGYDGPTGDSVFQRYARYLYYNPYPCSQFADEGPWVKKCDIFEYLAYSLPEPPLPADIDESSQQTGKLTVTLVTSRDPFKLVVDKREFSDTAYVLPKWFLVTPDEYGFTQYLYETHNTLGDSIGMVYDTTLNANAEQQAVYGRPRHPGMSPSGTTYIGAVDA